MKTENWVKENAHFNQFLTVLFFLFSQQHISLTVILSKKYPTKKKEKRALFLKSEKKKDVTLKTYLDFIL